MEKNKRIALNISGLSRYLEESYTNLKKFILQPAKKLGFEVDIFIHTWEMEGLVDDKWGFGGQSGRGSADHKGSLEWTINNQSRTKEGLISSINNIVTPTKLVVEKHSDKVPQFKRIIKSLPTPNKNVSPINMLSQLYSKYQCHLFQEEHQREKNFDYDYVIKYRTEIGLKRDLITDKILKLASKKIVIPERKSRFNKFDDSGDQLVIYYQERLGLADIFAIGKPEFMKRYNTAFPRLKYLIKNYKLFNPHNLLFRDIRGKYVKFDFK